MEIWLKAKVEAARGLLKKPATIMEEEEGELSGEAAARLFR
jgi:hypothetical protein